MKIDVIIGLYKEPRYISACLKSLPKNTEDYELNTILVEDCSPYSKQLKLHTNLLGHTNYLSLPDPEIEDIEEFVKQLVKVSLQIGFVPMTSFYRSHQAKQYGFLNSNADVICFSDEDIVFEEGFFDKIYNIFSDYKNIIVFGNPYRLRVGVFEKWQQFEKDNEWSTLDDIKRKTNTSASDRFFAVRRDLMIEAGGYPNRAGYGNDKAESCIRLAKAGGFLTLFEDLVYHHLEHTSTSGSVTEGMGRYLWVEKGYLDEYEGIDYGKYFMENKLIEISK